MATELFICRMAGFPVVRNNLMMATFEGTPKIPEAKALSFDMDWTESMAHMVLEEGRSIRADYEKAQETGEHPAAYSVAKADQFPCSYCNYPRQAESNAMAACNDHARWPGVKAQPVFQGAK
jgi:hypothetical protein